MVVLLTDVDEKFQPCKNVDKWKTRRCRRHEDSTWSLRTQTCGSLSEAPVGLS